MKKLVALFIVLSYSSVICSGEIIGDRDCWYSPPPIYIVIPYSNVLPTANDGVYPPERYNQEAAGVYYPAGLVHNWTYYKQENGDLYIWPYVWLGTWFVSHVQFVHVDGDLDLDGEVNNSDFLLFEESFGTTPGHNHWIPDADFNNNSIIDASDYLHLKERTGVIKDQNIEYLSSTGGEEQWNWLYIYNPILCYSAQPSAAMPEPSSLAIIILGFITSLKYPRKK